MEEEQASWWLTRWLKSEPFWQNVAIQTIGTLIAAVIIAVVAVLTGVGYTPAVRYYVLVGLVTVAGLVAYAAVALLFVRILYSKVFKSRLFHRHRFWTSTISAIAGAAVLAGSLNILPWVLLRLKDLIASWTGYHP